MNVIDYRVVPDWEAVQEVEDAEVRQGIWHDAEWRDFTDPFEAAEEVEVLEWLWGIPWMIIIDQWKSRDDIVAWERALHLYKETGALLDMGPLPLA
jgi:hypothetical protein